MGRLRLHLASLVALALISCARTEPRWADLEMRLIETLGHGGPVVVLLHGYGGDAEDLASTVRRLAAPAGTRFVLPEGPLRPWGALGGRAWWRFDRARLDQALAGGQADAVAAFVPVDLPAARARVVALLDEVQKRLGVSSRDIILGGFSQGAITACDVALHDGRPLRALVLMSGMPLAEGEWRPRLETLRGTPVLISHGRSDQVLPYALAERLRDEMKDAGLDVTFVPFDGGHAIAPAVSEALGAFLRR